MYKARKNVEIKGERRDIIEDYANFGSSVYAPITRDGLSLDKKANKYEVQPEALSSYQGIEELSRSLPPSVFTSKVSVDRVKNNFRMKLSRGDVSHKAQLEKAQASIQVSLKHQMQNEKVNEEENIMDKIQMRPNTPVYNDFETKRDDDIKADDYQHKQEQADRMDKRKRAVILLQRLLRGRAMQNMMFEGKEKRLDLIQELRATEEWKAASGHEDERTLIETYQERVVDGVSEALQASVIAKTMDNLSKELVRLKQERRIAGMVRLAEDVRRKREAEESGRRQAEQILREREDVLYQELMSVHQGTVDSYLQNIFGKTIDKTSSQQAFQEAKLKAQTLNKFIDKIESKKNKPEVMIKDLVSSFLIPDV